MREHVFHIYLGACAKEEKLDKQTQNKNRLRNFSVHLNMCEVKRAVKGASKKMNIYVTLFTPQ